MLSCFVHVQYQDCMCCMGLHNPQFTCINNGCTKHRFVHNIDMCSNSSGSAVEDGSVNLTCLQVTRELNRGTGLYCSVSLDL